MKQLETWYFEDFEVGQVFRTRSRTITEADVVQFAAWSWDTNPVHTDVQAASEGRFGRPIAHGLLGMSIAMGLASGLGVFEDCSIALLGVEGWRFENPLYVGDTVSCEVRIIGTRASTTRPSGVLDRTFRLSSDDGRMLQTGSIGLMVRRRSVG